MNTIRTAALIAAASLTAAVSANAQSAAAKTKGLMIGAHVSGSAIKFGAIREDANDEAAGSDKFEKGPGGGLVVGWGITKWLMIYGGFDIAKIKIDDLEELDENEGPFNVVPGDYTLTHADLGARFSFAGSSNFVPYANAAVSMRDATVEVLGEEASLRGPAFTVGGGVQYFFNPKLALDAGVQFTAGKFSEAEALGVKIDLDKYAEVKNSNSARVSVGLRFYPKWGSQK